MRLSVDPAVRAPNASSAADALDVLVEVLERLVHGHQAMLVLLQREKQAIATGNLEDVQACLAEKEALVIQLRREETVRIDQARRAAEYLGLADREASLADLAAVASPQHQARLFACRDRLNSLASSIHELNQLNGVLIERVLAQVGSLVDLLKHLMAPAPVYGAGGVLCDSPRGGRILGTG